MIRRVQTPFIHSTASGQFLLCYEVISYEILFKCLDGISRLIVWNACGKLIGNWNFIMNLVMVPEKQEL